ncbi:hypothetical protein BDF14DRAFT_1808956 [Spinellus fusiger]|nr:hypothetical protein BDF14DRAFT_1808956 [Spinellus fusiger]
MRPSSSRSFRASSAPRLRLYLWVVLALLIQVTTAQTLQTEKTAFQRLPDKFFYFQGSQVALWLDATGRVLWRTSDQGKQWTKVKDIGEDQAAFLYEHPFDSERAYVLGKEKTHWKTTDRGETWQPFTTPAKPINDPVSLAFHAKRSNYVLFHGMNCERGLWSGMECKEEVYYTLNNFEESISLRSHVTYCLWTLSTPHFENAPVKEIMCLEPDKTRTLPSLFSSEKQTLVQSEDFFKTVQPVTFAKDGEVIALSTVNRFLVSAIKPDPRVFDMDMHISLDGENWHNAVFPVDTSVQEKAFTIVESTGTSLLVDVLEEGSTSIGTLYKSNSNGTFFVRSLANTHRNAMGIVDFERVQGVEGVMVANVVGNAPQVKAGSANKELQTRMSFDDGSTWQSIRKVMDAEGQTLPCTRSECLLHLHSVTSLHNNGQVFSSASAVGVMMGVGSYGEYLLEYDECDTYLSVDGGLSWKRVRQGAHKYEFGDMGGFLVMMDDEKEADHLWWSKNRGETWQRHDLGLSLRARFLTTDPASTSRKFLLIGTSRTSQDHVYSVYLDFSDVFSRQCTLKEDASGDFERWYARDLTPGPDCLMGHEQMFYRRKASSDCYVGLDFKQPKEEFKECLCTETDYECDYNFVKQDNKCVRKGPDPITDTMCSARDSTYPSSSGYRLIPGNTCKREGGKKLDEPIERPCADNFKSSPSSSSSSHTTAPLAEPEDKNIKSYAITFDAEIEQFVYFKDSSEVLIRLQTGSLWHSKEHGIQWKQVLKEEGRVRRFVMHEFDTSRAYAILDNSIYFTTNRGADWTQIKVPAPPSQYIGHVLDFHPGEVDWLLLHTDSKRVLDASEPFISRDNGKHWDALDMDVKKCIFGRDSKYLIEKETVFCTVVEKSSATTNQRLVRTVDWGRHKEQILENVLEFFVVEDFMAVARSVQTDLSLFVSINGRTFAEAEFPPGQHIDRNTFTVLQSTTHAILLNVFKSVHSGKAYGALYKSNENGTFYHLSLDNTNGNDMGYVDYEKMQSLEGVILANQIFNVEEMVGGRDSTKKVRTMITWNDGGHWQPLAAPHGSRCSGDRCTLHLHSRTDIHGPGAIFSAASAPGLAMGVGNVGESLLSYDQSDTYLTRDAGHTWTMIQQGEHLYEFGDQGSLLVLVNDEGPTQDLVYSWDQGETWHTYRFSQISMRVNTLTTDPKSSTLRFILVGHSRDQQKSPMSVTVDFSNAKPRVCVLDKHQKEKSDFELWIAKDDDGDEACLLGKKTAYWRRKNDRVCTVENRFELPEEVEEVCECRDMDYECEFGFWRNENNECTFHGRHPDRPTLCKAGDKFKGRSGYKKNTKSNCKGGLDLEKQKEWSCGETGSVRSTRMAFTDRVLDYIYFTDTDRVFVRTNDNKLWRSDNDGYSWKELFPGTKIIAIYQNPHHEEQAFFITSDKSHYMTSDKGSNIEPMDTPLPPAQNIPANIMSFHNEAMSRLIYMGEADCSSLPPSCHTQAYVSMDNGRSWRPIGKYMRGCIWAREGAMVKPDPDTIFCEQFEEQSGDQRMPITNRIGFIRSNDFFTSREKIFESIVGVAVFGKFMVVAVPKPSGGGLNLHISVDGKVFAPAHFPASFELSPEAFTTMESLNSLWIHVTTHTHTGGEYGTIFTSNSNGTYFVSSLEHANRNKVGIVDFEKMQGIEGIAIANKVSNPENLASGSPKALVSMKTADAGAHWHPLDPPSKDSNGKAFDCQGKDCHLNLHSYSERRNVRDLFSASNAVGLMVGVGNVGRSLSEYRGGDMFLTRDAGKTWTEVYKRAHIWEFADQGALLILADDEQPTHVVRYTSNEGQTWNSYEFTTKDRRIRVEDIITQPDGTSQKYVLFGTESDNHATVAYHIDFSALHPTQCKLDLNHPEDDDFELWSPEDTRGEKCLFGRETKYHRRIQDRDCYIGERLIQPREVVRNCSCVEEDYECDFNFVRNDQNKCVLVPGLSPFQPECNDNIDFYYEPTGYRRIAATSCVGGLGLDEGVKHWCPGKSHGGGSWVFYVFAPLLAALVLYACLYVKKYGTSSGRIRLSEGSRASMPSNPWMARVVAALFVVPATLLGLFSRIRMPSTLPRLNVFDIRMPTFGRRGSVRYSALGQDEHTDVLMDDYDGSEEHLIDEADEEDADEMY